MGLLAALASVHPDSLIGRLVRMPSRLVPSTAELYVLSGLNRGRRWIAGSSTVGCWTGTYENDHQQVLRRLVAPGMVAYDIGANVGFYTLALSRLVEPNGRVFAFEPQPANAATLRRHVQINKISNVTIVEAAAWSKSEKVRFEGQHATGRVDLERGIEVSAVALDDFVAAGNPPPDFVKMDVEGGEVRALAGARTVLRARKSTWLVSTHSAALYADCRAVFLELGYAIDDTLLVGAVPLAPDFIATPG